MSTVNYAEVWTKLHEFGLTEDPRAEALFLLLADILPLTKAQVRIVGDLRPDTRRLGLSIGDRACIALGMDTHADVYTAEHK